MLERIRREPPFAGERFWPGTYVLVDEDGIWMWTGRWRPDGLPELTLDRARAKKFVGARHAYGSVEGVRLLQDWRARRVETKEPA
jgi:hypothetical protein